MMGIDPEPSGFTPEGLQGIHQFMQDYVRQGKSAGMLTAISRHGKMAHLACHGYADIGSGTPIRENTIFRIYSMTKAITSVALMTLMEKGHFQLDDAAKRWIPELANLQVYQQGPIKSDITIRQLLTHTAGFSYGFDASHPVDKSYIDIWRGDIHQKTLSEVIPEICRLPLIAQPGSRWHYSIATDICGYLVELISDMPFADYLQQTLFGPLNMIDTGFKIAAVNRPRLASLYGFDVDEPLKLIESAESSPLIPEITGKPINLHSGGSGLLSTLHDYHRFSQMMLNRGSLDDHRILDPHTVALMISNQISEKLLPLDFNGVAPGDFHGYGFGLGYCINIDPTQTAASGSKGDFGWGGLADTYCWVDPEQDMVAILMQQFRPSLHHAGRKDFRDAVYRALSHNQ